MVKVVPRPVEALRRLANRRPFYRLMYVVIGDPQGGGDAAC